MESSIARAVDILSFIISQTCWRIRPQAGVTVLFRRCLESVESRENRIVFITMETGETVRASKFIDATYEGDLLAAANVSYRVGR